MIVATFADMRSARDRAHLLNQTRPLGVTFATESTQDGRWLVKRLEHMPEALSTASNRQLWHQSQVAMVSSWAKLFDGYHDSELGDL